MSDNAPQQPADQTWVNVDDRQELAWWCDRLRCTEAELRLATRVVGPLAREVVKFLRGGRS